MNVSLHKKDFNLQLWIATPALLCFLAGPVGWIIGFPLAFLLGVIQFGSGLLSMTQLQAFNRKYRVLLLIYLIVTIGYLAILFASGWKMGAPVFAIPLALATYYFVLTHYRAFDSHKVLNNAPKPTSKNIIS